MSLPIHTLRRLVEIGGGLLWAVGLSACTYQGHIDEPVTVKATLLTVVTLILLLSALVSCSTLPDSTSITMAA